MIGYLPRADILSRRKDTMQTIRTTVERQTSGFPPITVEYQMGENLNELLSQFGESVVYTHARRSFVSALQSYVRSMIDKGVDQGSTYEAVLEEVLEGVKTWRPSRRRAKMTDKEKAQAILDRLSPAERMAVFRDYEATERAGLRSAAASDR
jgi:hypothetical protein